MLLSIYIKEMPHKITNYIQQDIPYTCPSIYLSAYVNDSSYSLAISACLLVLVFLLFFFLLFFDLMKHMYKSLLVSCGIYCIVSIVKLWVKMVPTIP